MRRFTTYGLWAVLSGSLLTASFAAHAEPRPFVAPQGLSPEEIERLKQESKSNLSRYHRDEPAKETPFPWMSFMLGVIALCAVTPFAWRAYQNSAREIREHSGRESNRTGREEDDAA